MKKALKSLVKLQKPDGSRDNPALSCKDLKACYPDKEDGKYVDNIFTMFYKSICWYRLLLY